MNKERFAGLIVALEKKRKTIMTFAIVVCVCAFGIFGYSIYNDDRSIAPASLPESIITFVEQYFPDRHIISAEIDFMDYEIWLDDDTNISFEWNRKWDKIETYESVINPELIPPAITAYVEKNFQGAILNKISKESNGYEIGISGTNNEYKFNNAGQYRHMEWDD